ncbi:MAG: DUF362 domain-containing protein [Planctomycetota bacterium]
MQDQQTTLVDWSDPEPAPKTMVGTARCISYGRGRVREAVRICVQELPDVQERFERAERVLVKPNLLSSTRRPEDHVNTHPAVVWAVAELLSGEFGCRVSIGDSCGSMSEGSTARAIRRSGMDEVAEELGADLYNVDSQPRHALEPKGAELFREIQLPISLRQFDLVVSVAKFKTHVLTGMTGAVKNMLGLVPGAAKKDAHVLAPGAEDFAVLLADLYAVLRPGAAFVDGVVAMEGQGPANGNLRHLELIAGSCDPVALDAFCAQVAGLQPLQVPVLARCHERRLGVADPEQISVRGEGAEAFAPGDFRPPSTYLNGPVARVLPRWLVRSLLQTFTKRYADIDREACQRCGECARNCPSQAIHRESESGLYRVDRSRCISCYCCAEVCPYDAIDVLEPWPTRLWEGLKAKVGSG